MGKFKELAIDELNEAAKDDTTPDVEFKEPNSNIMRYIKGINLESGRVPVATFVIYHHYHNRWEPQGKKLSYIEFFRQFNKVFQQKRTGPTRYYMLRKGIYNIDGDSVDVARQFREEIKKKQAKVPSTES